jgi:hypothetical protein
MDFNVNMKSNENRPMGLLVVCILSWVHIGFSFVVSAFQMLTGPLSDKQLESSQADLRGAVLEMKNSGVDALAEIIEKLGNMTHILNEHHYQALSLTLFGLIIGFVGVSMMFLGRKIGFHLYIIYSIYSIGQIYLFFSAAEIPSLITWFGLIVSGIFIALYAKHLKWLK